MNPLFTRMMRNSERNERARSCPRPNEWKVKHWKQMSRKEGEDKMEDKTLTGEEMSLRDTQGRKTDQMVKMSPINGRS